MKQARPEQQAGTTRRRGRRWLVLAIVVAGVLAAWKWWPRDHAGMPPPEADPRLSFVTPYRNVRPEVAYVGDAVCAGCHPDIAKTFARHPMGESLSEIAAASPLERYDRVARNPFMALGLEYEAQRRGERVVHKETRRDEKGSAIELEAEVQYAVGSGRNGRSYLFNRGGYLFQSPMTWYPLKQHWDLSPSFATNSPHFERPITADCLFCHCNHADKVEHTVNHYREPIFRGLTIGCERCHGPGQLHVEHRKQPEPIGDLDDTIVNPRRLEPALREAVCQQCHLQGARRIVRRGRGDFDFRPGLPLHLFVSVFVEPPEAKAKSGSSFVGQVEQMEESRCFQASGGKLGCISCHDPHRLPSEAEGPKFYRDRCLSCHQDRGCNLPLAERQAKQDNCMICHMPRNESGNITHVAVTDHRILRDPKRTSSAKKPASLRDGDKPLCHFHEALAGADDPAVKRDLGIALWDLGTAMHRQPLIQAARPLLETAVQAWPDDLDAWHALGRVYWFEGKGDAAQQAFETVLAKAPEHELVLHDSAALMAQLRQREQAIEQYRRLIQVNPWQSSYHFELAQLHADAGDWQAARDECRAVVRLNIANLDARKVLITSLLKLDEETEARAELKRLQAFEPGNKEALERWFAGQARSER